MRNIAKYILFLTILIPIFTIYAQDINSWNAELDGIIYDLDVSSNGSLLLMGTRNDLAIAYSPDGEVLWSFQPESGVLGVGTSNDGQHSAIVSEDRNLYLLDATGAEVWRFRASQFFTDVAMSADGLYLAATDEQNKVYLFSIESNEPLWENVLRNLADTVDIIGTESPIVVVGTRDSRVIQFDIAGETIQDIQLSQQITSVAGTSDGSKIAATTLNGDVTLVDSASGETLWQTSIARNCTTRNRIDCINLDMDASGKRILVATHESSWYLLDAEDGTELQATTFSGKSTAVAISEDGSWLMVGNRDGEVIVTSLSASTTAFEQSQLLQRNLLIGTIIFLIVGSLAGRLWVQRTASGHQFWTETMFPVRNLMAQMWRSRLSYMMLIPTFALLIVFNYYPAFSGLYHSFTEWKPGVETTWVGLDQFAEMFDSRFFWSGIQNMLILAISAFVKLSIPLLVAEFIFHIRWDSLQYSMRTMFIIPLVLPSVVGVLLWVNIYDPNIGLLNNTLEALGLESWMRSWLGERNTAMAAIVAIGAPWVNPLALLIFYGGLIGIPNELFDAAKVDGANWWTRFWRIDIPLLMGQIRLLVVLVFIGSMQEFQLIFLTTGGGPGSSTYTPALELYYQATRFNNYGLASAMGTFLFLIILGGTIINLQIVRSRTEYQP